MSVNKGTPCPLAWPFKQDLPGQKMTIAVSHATREIERSASVLCDRKNHECPGINDPIIRKAAADFLKKL